jgi:hopanoid biosynthesis associated protein HpnK
VRRSWHGPLDHFLEIAKTIFNMKRIIVTADDFGLCPEVNEAVLNAHRHGLLTSASLMVTGAAFEEAVRLAKETPTLKVGLHLVLINGCSVLGPEQIPDIVDHAKRFSNKIVSAGIHYFRSPVAKRQVARECEAQIEAFLATGLSIDHLNSHNNLHVHPGVLDIVLPLVQRYRIPAVRLPLQGLRSLNVREAVNVAVMAPWARRLRRLLVTKGILFNREIFGLFETGHLGEKAWLKLIPRIKEGLTEVYCHPAARNAALLHALTPSYSHVDEYRALLSPKVKARLNRHRVSLTTFSDVARSQISERVGQ